MCITVSEKVGINRVLDYKFKPQIISTAIYDKHSRKQSEFWTILEDLGECKGFNVAIFVKITPIDFQKYQSGHT